VRLALLQRPRLVLVVPDACVELQGQRPDHAAVLHGDHDRRPPGTSVHVGDPQEVVLPVVVTRPDELAVRLCRHPPGFGVLLRCRLPDLHRRRRLAEPSDDRPSTAAGLRTVRFVDLPGETGKMDV